MQPRGSVVWADTAERARPSPDTRRPMAPTALPGRPGGMEDLQRQIGNRAVVELLEGREGSPAVQRYDDENEPRPLHHELHETGKFTGGVRHRGTAEEQLWGRTRRTSGAQVTVEPLSAPSAAITTEQTVEHGEDDQGRPVTTTRAHEMSFDPTEGRVTLGGKGSSGPERAQTTRGASSTIDFGSEGLEGVSGRAESSNPNGRSLNVAGGFTVSLESPRWVPRPEEAQEGTDEALWVKVQSTVSVTGEAGTGWSFGPSARRGGVAGTFDIGRTVQHTRHFDSMAEADAWVANAEGYFREALILQLFESPQDIEDIKAMEVGESWSIEDRVGGSLGASGRISSLRVGGTFHAGDRHRVVVERTDRDHVIVTVTEISTAGVSATGGTGVGMELGTEGSQETWRKLEFTIGPEGDEHVDEGRRALENMLDDRPPPLGMGGDGWRQLESGTAESEATTHGASAGGLMGVGFGEEMQEEQYVDEEGQTRHRLRGTHTASASALFGLLEGGSQAQIELADEVPVKLSATVDGSSAEDAHRALAAATGAESRLTGVSGEASGQWAVEATLSPQQFLAFLRCVWHGNLERSATGVTMTERALPGLRTSLREAGSLTDAHRAVAEFVADVGHGAIALIRNNVPGEVHYDVQLVGDSSFIGAAGRAALRRRIGALERRIGGMDASDAEALLAEVTTTVGQWRSRLAHMADPDRYQDLPPSLREREAERLRPLVQQLESLQGQAAAAAAGARQRAELEAVGAEVGPQSFDPRSLGGGGEFQRQLSLVEGDGRRMQGDRSEVEQFREGVQREWDIHTGRAAVHFMNPAREGLTGWLRREENDRYERVELSLNDARDHYQTGVDAQEEFEFHRDQLATHTTLTPEIEHVPDVARRHAWTAAWRFRQALSAYRQAWTLLRSIRRDHPAREYWGDTP